MSDIKLAAKLKNDIDYEQIVKDILNDSDFQKIGEIKHHYTTDRLTHSMKVSYYAYRIAKGLNFNYVYAARSGLLHDYYFELPCDQPTMKAKRKLMITNHTLIAIENSKKKYDLSAIEVDAIRSHMFPVDHKIPRYKESWVVMLSDKIASFGEFSYRCEYTCILCFLVIMNWLMN